MTLVLANWVYGLGVLTGGEAFNLDVVRTLSHSIVVAELTLSEVTARDDTLACEPGPWSAHLTTIAAEREALLTIAASSSVSDREKGSEFTISSDAHTVVKGLGCAVGPARSAVGLVAHVVNHFEAARPVLASVKVLR